MFMRMHMCEGIIILCMYRRVVKMDKSINQSIYISMYMYTLKYIYIYAVYIYTHKYICKTY